jgi:hypothetical protein
LNQTQPQSVQQQREEVMELGLVIIIARTKQAEPVMVV